MAKFNLKSFFAKNWIHFLAIGLFFIITLIYFKPQFDGYRLKQHDIEQYKGMSNEIVHFRETTGEEPLWTNSMFGGMPAYQISVDYKGNLLDEIVRFLNFGMKSPAGLFILYMIGFYIMLLCMRVKPMVAIFGSLAFAFSSYYVIILQAGHNSKAEAIALMAPVIGAFYMAYRYNLKWGLILSALFMGLHLTSNHFQITYYLAILLLGLGVVELIRVIKSKNWSHFLKATIGIIVSYIIVAAINYGNISLTNDYAKHTIRGGNDITINVDGTSSERNSTSGLDKDYITQWSYGIGESMTLVSPYVKGGSNGAIKSSQFSDVLRDPDIRREASLVAENDVYWGAQPFVSGPVYVGIIVFFLAVLGMIYLKGPLKWGLALVTILMLMLSWGKNFMGLTEFFIEYVPGYNKFRAVTIILAVVELIIPLLGVLFLSKLIKEREAIKENIKPFFVGSGSLVVLLFILTFSGLGDGYLSPREQDFIYNYESQVRQQIMNEDPQRLQQNGIDINNPQQVDQLVAQQVERVDKQFGALTVVREKIYRQSMLRSILFLFLGIGLILVYIYLKVPKEVLIIGLSGLVLIDLIMVDLNYLNNEKTGRTNYEYWVPESKFDFPLSPTKADKEILAQELEKNPELKSEVDKARSMVSSGPRSRINQDELWLKKFQILNMNTNYRVYEPRGGFNSSRSSYFHKSLNGYHGAKLRRIQNLMNFHIGEGNMDVLNMLNVKYFIQQNSARTNPGALGNAWLVKELMVEEHPNDELLALGNLYQIENLSDSKLVVNGNEKSLDTLSGRENVFLLRPDSLSIDLSQVKRSGVDVIYAEDINGQRNWIPLEQLKKDTTNSFKKLLEVRKVHDFSPRDEAVIGDEESKGMSSLTFSAEGNIELTSYAPNKLKYDVNVTDNQFAVFSEIYYPDGWKAYINGEEVPINRVNYLLRGIELPKGNYELVMKFEEPKYHQANTISLVGSILILLIALVFFVKDFILASKED
tara:strand:- start:40419 stop:43373 length:2955 start_codon:yes stop_codon:yes gene_type:complete